jgi:hypothetical protein
MQLIISSLHLTVKDLKKIDMKYILASLVILFLHTGLLAQQVDPAVFGMSQDKINKFLPYFRFQHGDAVLNEMKANEPAKYYFELWVLSESFSVMRNHFTQGIQLDESIIDIRRFNEQRLNDNEAIVVLDGFKDVLKLKSLIDVNAKKIEIENYFNK